LPDPVRRNASERFRDLRSAFNQLAEIVHYLYTASKRNFGINEFLRLKFEPAHAFSQKKKLIEFTLGT
jgi:hypothetical protein